MFHSLNEIAAASMCPGSDQAPTYRGTEFHRIVPKFMIQGGDFTRFDGTGGYAAPVTNKGLPTFPDENLSASHDREGILSMANRGPNTNGSQFFVTLGPTPHLDGKHVAFGRVVRGMETVHEASRVETEAGGRPAALQRVVIVDCGLGTGDDDDDSSSLRGSNASAESHSSEDRRRKRSKHKKERRRRRDEDSFSSRSSNASTASYSSEDRRRKTSKTKKERRRRKDEDHGAHRRHGKRSRGESRRDRKRRKRDDREERRRDRTKRKERRDKKPRRRRSRSGSGSSPQEDGDSARSSKERRHGDKKGSDDEGHSQAQSNRAAAATKPPPEPSPPAATKGPMTQQKYLELQSQIREVIDPHTGRTRWMRGTGEIVERLVSREEHAHLNRRATAGDGRGFALDVVKAAARAAATKKGES